MTADDLVTSVQVAKKAAERDKRGIEDRNGQREHGNVLRGAYTSHNGSLCRRSSPLGYQEDLSGDATRRKIGPFHHLFLFLEATSVLKCVFTAVTMIVNDNDKEARLANRVEKGKCLSGRCLAAIERTYKNEYIEIVKPGSSWR